MAGRWQELEYNQTAFEDIKGLDKRVVKGLKRLGFANARPVQFLALPHAFAGADILLKAPTGTGKTLAYAVPVINSVITRLTASDGLVAADYIAGEATNSKINWRHRYEAIILAPSRELVHQLTNVIKDLSFLFSDLIRPVGLTECPKQLRDLADKLALSNILITNPGALLAAAGLLRRGLASGKSSRDYLQIFPNVKHIVLDEADLVFNVYGYDDEVSAIFSPTTLTDGDTSKQLYQISICPTDHLTSCKAQVFLVSATVNQDLKTIRDLALYRPKVLSLVSADEALPDLAELDDGQAPGEFSYVRLTFNTRKKCDHRYVLCDRKRCEDYIFLCGMLKDNHFSMNEAAPKTLIFTNSPASAVKCQLILSSFGFKVGRAIGTQSLTDRLRSIQKFNSGLVDILVTMDSQLLSEVEGVSTEIIPKIPSPKKQRRKDKASLLSRGLDYKQVARVILLEPASSLDDYVHKVGRCGRDQEISNIIPTAISIMTEAEANEPAWAKEIAGTYSPTLPDDFSLGTFIKYQYRVEDFAKKASKNVIKNVLDTD